MEAPTFVTLVKRIWTALPGHQSVSTFISDFGFPDQTSPGTADQSNVCNLRHLPKITLSHWLFSLGYILYLQLSLANDIRVALQTLSQWNVSSKMKPVRRPKGFLSLQTINIEHCWCRQISPPKHERQNGNRDFFFSLEKENPQFSICMGYPNINPKKVKEWWQLQNSKLWFLGEVSNSPGLWDPGFLFTFLFKSEHHAQLKSVSLPGLDVRFLGSWSDKPGSVAGARKTLWHARKPCRENLLNQTRGRLCVLLSGGGSPFTKLQPETCWPVSGTQHTFSAADTFSCFLCDNFPVSALLPSLCGQGPTQKCVITLMVEWGESKRRWNIQNNSKVLMPCGCLFGQYPKIGENKKRKFSFFPSKTCSVDKF